MKLTTHTGTVQSEERKYFYESLERLPEDGVPDDLPTVEDPKSTEEQDAQQEDAENQIPHQSHSTSTTD